MASARLRWTTERSNVEVVILMLLFVTKATVAVKVAYVAVGTLLLSFSGWTATLVGQISESPIDPIATAIPAAALTATSGALVWVVKQIAGGNLVHRDPAHAEGRLADATAKLAALTEASIKREAALHELLLRNARHRDVQDDEPGQRRRNDR